jgi:hypothetical protein
MGRVVDDRSLQPLPGRSVAIGPLRAVTDENGGFTVDDVPETYDLAIAEPEGQTASVYRGLHRRDPLLVHEIVFPDAGAHVAEIAPSLTGGGPLKPGDSVVVGFVASSGTLFAREPFGAPCGPRYPTCDWVRLVWRGPETITGEVVALLVPGAARAGGAPVLLGHQKVTVRSQSLFSPSPDVDEHNCANPPPPAVIPPPDPAVRVALQLAPVPRRHVAVEYGARYLARLSVLYRWPARGGMMGLSWPRAQGERLPPGPAKLEADLPDLSGIGARLCLEALTQPNSRIETCDVPADEPVKLRMLAPFTSSFARWTPKREVPLLARETRISWERSQGAGFYLLILTPPQPLSGYPMIHVYTDGTSAGWPDLAALGVPFPADFVSYGVTLAGFGPFATLDEAVSPGGMGADVFADRQTVWGHPAEREYFPSVILTPTGAAPAEPSCDAPNIDCGPPPDCGCSPPGCWCGLCEFFSRIPRDLRQADRTLALHPGLAAALGQRCIRDCGGLRAFREAFQSYNKTHHGFAAFDTPDPYRGAAPPARP